MQPRRRGPTYNLQAFREQVRERYCGRKETAERKQKILDGLSAGMTVSRACREAGVGPGTGRDWRNKDPIFKRLWDEAVEAGIDTMEDEAVRRGRDGIEKPVFYQGEQVAVVQEYSDTLLISMLKFKRYADRQEITGKDGAPLTAAPQVVVPWDKLKEMSDEDLQRLYMEQVEGAKPPE
jgi:hypothetical protein